jgi:hypothetical protein
MNSKVALVYKINDVLFSLRAVTYLILRRQEDVIGMIESILVD